MHNNAGSILVASSLTGQDHVEGKIAYLFIYFVCILPILKGEAWIYMKHVGILVYMQLLKNLYNEYNLITSLYTFVQYLKNAYEELIVLKRNKGWEMKKEYNVA